MRLGLLIYGSLDTLSGGFLYDRKLVQYLLSHGDEVEVISVPWRQYGRGLLDNLSLDLIQRLKRATFELLAQDELAHPSFFLLNRLLRCRIRCPIISLVHHLRSREVQPAWQTRLYRWVERQYLASVDGFICVSRTTKTDVEELVGNGKPTVVAYPGGDSLPVSMTRERIGLRARLPGPLQIIFVGNLIPRKGLHTLIDALATLPKDSWRLIVAGSLTVDPAYVRMIQQQIARSDLSEDVLLPGVLSPAELACQLTESHLLAVPSSYEGFGIAYLEGMRFGLPAIASTAGAAKEIITHGENGFLVPPGDAAILAGCIRELIHDRERLVRMSLAAERRFASHPTWDESAALIRRFLREFQV